MLGSMLAAGSAGLLAFPIKAASEMEETMGKFGVVFGKSADDVKVWSDATAKAVGVSKEAMAGMLASMQDLLVPMGVLPEEATGMSKTLSSLAVDLASFNNMDTAQVFENLMSAITGEGQVMKKYGVILNETAVKQELLNMKLDPKVAENAAKAQARLNIILRGTTAAQGDAIRTASSFANQVKILWANVTDASGAIGGAFLEDTAAFVHMAHSAVSVVRDFAVENKDLVRVMALATIAVGGLGVGLVATGIAAKVTASTIGVVGVAAKAAAVMTTLAWSTVGAVFFALTIKSRIAAAVITTGWTIASKAVSIAWQAATSLIGIALQGLTAIVSAAAVASPWIAGAAAIAVAYFGLDAVLGALAAAAAVAWSASAATVTAAWTAAAGVLGPIAIAISGAWAAAATFVGTAWTSLKSVLVSTGIAGAAGAALMKLAYAGLGVIVAAIAAEQSISAAFVAVSWKASAFVSSTAWAGFIAVLTAALTPAFAMKAAAGIVAGAWVIGAGAVSAAWSIAWAVITSPIMPFVAAGAVVLGVITAMGVGIGVLAVKAMDFGKAFEKAKSMLTTFVGVVTDTFDAVKAAMMSGDYATAGQALWVGVRLAFWEGVAGAMDAFSWLWREATLTAHRFFMSLLKTTQKVMAAIVQAITNPYKATKAISSAIADLASSASGFDPASRANAAREELRAIKEKFDLEKKAAEVQKKSEDFKNGNGSLSGSSMAQLLEINRLESSGAISEEDAKKARKVIESYEEKVSALKLEILALTQGEKAADRKRLADEGLNASQIKNIELLKEKKKALDDEAEAQKKAAKEAEEAIEKAKQKSSRKQVDSVFKTAGRMAENGVSADVIFKRVMEQISKDENAGRITKGDAEDARETAAGNLDDRMDALRREGKALAEALRTPLETLNAKLADIDKLKGVGAIGQGTADRAIADARKTFSEEEQQNKKKAEKLESSLAKEQERTGPSGSFSAAGAAIIGMGGREDEAMKIRKLSLKELGIIAKNAKKNNVARFG